MRAATRFQCTAVAFSPFEERQIAVGSSQHFGIVGLHFISDMLCFNMLRVCALIHMMVCVCVGNGCQSVYMQQPRGLVEVRQFPTQDAVNL